MELNYYGANCFKIITKKAKIVIDDNLSELGLKSVTTSADIALNTEGTNTTPARLIIDQPGEYEVSDISVQGIAARGHRDEEDSSSSTMFRIVADDIRLVVVGHIYPELSDIQLEAIGTADVLIVPVGGSGYTMDGVGALKLIKKIEPKIVIPAHYNDSKIKYPVPQAELSAALKDMAMDIHTTTDKLKLKSGEFPEALQLIVLEKQNN